MLAEQWGVHQVLIETGQPGCNFAMRGPCTPRAGSVDRPAKSQFVAGTRAGTQRNAAAENGRVGGVHSKRPPRFTLSIGIDTIKFKQSASQ